MSLNFSLQPQILPQYQDKQFGKMDILFYDSINGLKSSLTKEIIFHLLKALIFIIFIPIDYTVINSPNDGKILAAQIIALITSLLQAFVLVLWRCRVLSKTKVLFRICKHMNHCTTQPLNINNVSSLQDCVSKTMYNQPNLTLISNEGLTQQIKQNYQKILAYHIKNHLKQQQDCMNRLDSLFGFLGFSSMIWACIALGVSQKNTPQLVLLIIYIVAEAMTKLLIVVVMLLLALAPLLCLICCFCACFCSGGQEGAVRLPPSQKATQAMITQADGTCSICFQNFVIGSDVIRLKCSPKHMFHPFCIQSWVKVRSNCPICRTSVTEQVNRSLPL